MCQICGYTPCTCTTPRYTYNWYNIDNYNCNPCSQPTVCKKKIPSVCTFYNGPALDGLGLTTDVNVELIIANVNVAVKALKTENEDLTNKLNQLLDFINDLNGRLVIIEGQPHPTYNLV